MKRKVLKVSIACMLLITLTAVNFIAVGADLVSYALESTVSATKTNHENVGFAVYLKDAEGNKQTNTNVDINSEEMKICLDVQVSKEGYFNGEVKIKNSNFEFVSSQSENVNRVTSDTVTLNQINAGTNSEIEVVIKPKISENLELNVLNMESELELTGIYKDSTEKDNKIKGTRTIQISYVSTATENEVNNQLEVLTNDIEVYNGEEKRVLQLSLKTGLKENSYPVKHITSQVSVPVINGEEPQIEEKANLKGMSNWNAKYESGTVTVDIENEPNAGNKINWSKEGNEEIILTYIYGKDTVINEASITAKTTITLHDGKEIKATDSTITIIKDEVKTGIITVKGEVEEELYKGKLYAGVNKEYKAKTEIEVNLDKVAETIYVNENTTSIPSNYIRTTINKNNLVDVLGENGLLEISTKTAGGTNSIATIATTTPADQNGNIVIDYPEGVNNIVIRATGTIKKGNLTIEHTKAIIAGNVQTAKTAKELVTTIDGTFSTRSTEIGTIPTTEVKAELKETTTEAKLEVNRGSLSTVTENKNVQIKAVLLSNAENYDLYKNPTIEIEMPADVVSMNVNSINKIYGDEFTEVIPTQGVVNGRQVVRIELKGAQTEYKEPGIDGTEIIINADLVLNNKATSKQDTVKMTYTNESANQYKEGATTGTEIVNMEVVSPKGLIATNNMSALDVQTIGEEEKVSKTIERKVGAKQVKVEKEIINNNETPVNNVTVLGTFATNGTKNNLDVALKSGMTVEGIDTNKVKVYYSENENATNELEKTENAWKETATSETETKKYLVTITDMQISEGLKLSYDMEIPANLDYNKVAEENYEVAYTESNTGVSQKVKATTIELTTGTGPVIEATLSAKLGSNNLKENQEVKQGEIITYKTEVKNTGTEPAKGLRVIAEVPEGVQVIENNEQVIEEIQPGETKEVEYKAQISKDVQENSEIATKSEVEYNEETKETNEVKNKVAEGNISVLVQHDDQFFSESEEILVDDDSTAYYATIKNLTNEERKNVKFTWEFDGSIEIEKQEVMTEDVFEKYMSGQEAHSEDGYKKEENNNEITIESIPANGSVVVYIQITAKQIEENSEVFTISSKLEDGNKTYSSNTAEGKVKNINNYEIKLSAHNENEYVKPGDVIEYTLNVENKNEVAMPNVLIEDNLSKNLSIKEIEVEGQKTEIPSDNDVKVTLDMEPGEEKEIKISTLVDNKESMKESEEILNKAIIYTSAGEKESNEISHKMVKKDSDDVYTDENGNAIHTYKISGTAWEDQNADGARDDTEVPLGGINVQLLNTVTNELAKNPKGEIISTSTADDGNYTLSGIPNGEYLVLFRYDASMYRTTEYKKAGVDAARNSDVVPRKLAVNGEETTYGVTDAITITENSIANINIGLAKSEKFDLQLDKYISKIVVQTASGTQTINYNGETLAKVELKAKEMQGANVVIEYKVRVTNAGELEGYVKNIVDYLPKDLTFKSELNKDWYQEGSCIYNNSLSNQKLVPGESKEVTLTVTKDMTEDNTGLINNLAEIKEDYNEAGMTDINSTPGNKTQGENDMGSADVIVSVKTGGPVMYTTLIIALLIVLAAGIFFIKKDTKMKDEII